MQKLKKILQFKYIFFLIFAFSLLFVFLNQTLFKQNSKLDINDKTFQGTILDYKFDGNKLTFTLKAKEKILVNYYFNTEKDLNNMKKKMKYGIRVEVKGNLQKPSNNTIPNTFNYKNYLYHQNIFYILNCNKIKIINVQENILYKIKNNINSRIDKFKNKEYYKAFILGNKNDFSTEFLDNIKNNGINHLFAISGMHISLFTFILFFILKKIKVNDNISFIIIIFFLIFYLFLTSFAASLIRAFVFFALLKVNNIFKLKIKTIDIFLLSIAIILFINPQLFFNIGFIYSSVTTFGLILSNNLIKRKNYFKNLIIISTIAFLFSLPITSMYFYEINLLSIFNNLIFVPLISFIIYPSILLSLFFSFLEPFISILIYILEVINNFFSKITFLKILVPKNKFIVYLIYYLFLILIIKTQNIKYIILFILTFIFLFIYPKFSFTDKIYFLDVGQGDSILLRSKFNKEIILIDTGGTINYNNDSWQKRKKEYHVSDNTITFLKSIGVRKIDILILTHGDYDHMGEAINLINNFKVEKVIFNCGTHNDLENKLINVLDKKNIKYYSCIKKLNIDRYKLKFLNTKTYDNENDNSNVVYFNYNNYKFLLMGDAGVEKEKDILDKYNLNNIDFLKVGHHGSNTSSSEKFINNINPKYSLISVGKNNRYGHPKDKVLKTLKNSKVYRTDLVGSIEIKLNKNGYKIRTCQP